MENARAIPLQDWTGPEASRRLRLQDSWHMKVARLSAVLTCHLYPPGNRMLEQLNPIPLKLFMECGGGGEQKHCWNNCLSAVQERTVSKGIMFI